MADAEFWRDLAFKFRTLSRQQDINGLLAAKLNADGEWTLIGRYSYTAQFGALASLGAKGLGYGTGLIGAWLQALMDENPDSLEVRNKSANVLKICGASADFCETLESRAMEGNDVFQSIHPAQEQLEDTDRRTREERLQSFIADNQTSIAAVCRAARVHKPNMHQWRKETMADGSVMAGRIKEVLNGKTPLDARGKKMG
jgi:hypothetical protein